MNNGIKAIRRAAIALCALSMLVGTAACGQATSNSAADAKSTTEQPQKATPKPQPADLTGTWKQTNASDDSWMEAEITDDTITVQWVGDSGNTKSLYWKGSFNAPDKAGDWKWTSQGDTTAMQASLLGSQDSTKDFTYTAKTGVSWETTMMGTTVTVTTEKQ